MITFVLSFVALILGYLVYGRIVEKVFGVDENRPTPCEANPDGVDFVPISEKKSMLIQLLNIAGLGPIFGPIMGALWGPVAFLWIVLGSIFAGAVHDYFSGMLSIRHNGAGLPKIVEIYLGSFMGKFTNAFALLLLVLVGVVFVAGPAALLAALTPDWMNLAFWTTVIFIYYILATLLPIDKIIGRLYPVFGAILLIMAVGIGGGLIVGSHAIPELTFANLHPKALPLWPLVFITIACGAISGFHATQSPMMARCVTNERQGRRVFYGMMIAEGAIALVWAAAGMSFFDGSEGLQKALATLGGPAGVVRHVSISMLGAFGGTLAILGVVVLPITSGDTAFRGARLLIADFLDMKQASMTSRLKISVPLFVVGFLISLIDFNFIWRYFSWANQTTAMIMLWAAAAYLYQENKLHWIASIPATFMTAVSMTYILQAPEGFGLPVSISYPGGLGLTVLIVIAFVMQVRKRKANAATAVSRI
jgi:carbon starvation protein CstA